MKGFGGVLSPFTAFLVARGLRTFALRQRQAVRVGGDPRGAPRRPPGTSPSCTTRPSLPPGARARAAADARVRLAALVRAAGRHDQRDRRRQPRARGGEDHHPRGQPRRRPQPARAPRVHHALDDAAATARARTSATACCASASASRGPTTCGATCEARPRRRSVLTVRPVDRLVVVGARQHNLKNVSVSPSARQDRGLHRAERFGQVVARVRHDLRRGAAAVRRVAQRLRAAVPGAARQARRRAHRRALARPSPSSSGRCRSRRARPSAPSPRSPTTCACSIRARGRAPLPQLRQAHRGADRAADRRSRARAPRRRRACRCSRPSAARARGS